MMAQIIVVVLIFVIPGIFSIVYTLHLLSGRGNKATYMADHIYAGRVYAAIPWGIAAILVATGALSKNIDVGYILILAGGGFVLLGLIIAFIQPSFLKPEWLKWLEREYGEMIPIFRSEVQKMGDDKWNERIQTQEDLEEWVEEVKRKYKL